MKKRLFLLSALLAAAVLMGGCRLMTGSDKLPQPTASPYLIQDSSLTMLDFSESSSYFKRVQGYEFRAEDGKYTAYFFMANEEEPYPVPVDQPWVDTLTGFINQYSMMSWDGFRGSDSMLLDGTSFSFSMEFSDGATVHASGYGSFPAGYGGASNAIETHFLQLLPEDMRDW